jgi:hypothetical protein
VPVYNDILWKVKKEEAMTTENCADILRSYLTDYRQQVMTLLFLRGKVIPLKRM